MIRPRLLVPTLMVLAAAATRLLPHPPNMTSIAAVALFAGAHFSDRRLAFAVPLAAMALSDVVLGVHSGLLVVYASFALIVCLGLLLRDHRRPVPILAAAFSGSVLFFVLTNLAVWASGGMYPVTLAGLLACYTAALPFFGNSLAGDLIYGVLLFGGFALLERRFPVLEMRTAAKAA